MKDTYPLDYGLLSCSVGDKDFNSAMIIDCLLARMAEEGVQAAAEPEQEESESTDEDIQIEQRPVTEIKDEKTREYVATEEELPIEANISHSGPTRVVWLPEDEYVIQEFTITPNPSTPPAWPDSAELDLPPVPGSAVSSYKSFATDCQKPYEEEKTDEETDEVEPSDAGSAPFSSGPASSAVNRRVFSQELSYSANNDAGHMEEPNLGFIDSLRKKSTDLIESLIHPSGPHFRENMTWVEFEHVMNNLGFESSSENGYSFKFDPPNEQAGSIFFDKIPSLDQYTLKQFGQKLKDQYGLDEGLLLHYDDRERGNLSL